MTTLLFAACAPPASTDTDGAPPSLSADTGGTPPPASTVTGSTPPPASEGAFPSVTYALGPSLTVQDFRDEQHGFHLQDVLWGISPQELDALPQYSIGSVSSTIAASADEKVHSHAITIYLSGELIEIEGNRGFVFYEFSKDKLYGVSLKFQTNLIEMRENDLDALFDAMYAQAEEAFGPPAISQENEPFYWNGELRSVTTVYSWLYEGELGATRLNMAQSAKGMEGSPASSVSFDVNCIDVAHDADCADKD